ncbi:hypothetical protein H0H93_010892 [Arthromyces matolae]|nr:hypothetical protein H0H93_010892 [Arthromyces matolae]
MAPKSWATTEQYTFLTKHLTGFVEAKLKKKDSRSTKQLTRYTNEVIKEFFANWPEETALVHNGLLPQSVVDTPRSQWTPVEQKIVADAVAKRQKKISNWLRNRFQDAVGMKATKSRSSNVVLASLIKPAKRQRLHKADEKYQQMFYDSKLRALVQAEWERNGITANAEDNDTEEQEGDGDESSKSSVRSLKMTLRRKVVADTWKSETPEVRLAVFTALQEEKAEMIRSMDMSKEGLDRDPEQRELVISNLVSLLENVSQEIHRLCGWCTTVITGGPNPALNNLITIQTVTFGESEASKTTFLGAYPQFKQAVSEPYVAWLRNVFPQYSASQPANLAQPSQSDNAGVATPTHNSETATTTSDMVSRSPATDPNIITPTPNSELVRTTPGTPVMFSTSPAIDPLSNIVTPTLNSEPTRPIPGNPVTFSTNPATDSNIITAAPNSELAMSTPVSMFPGYPIYAPFHSSPAFLSSDISNLSTSQFCDTSNPSLHWDDLTAFSKDDLFDTAISMPPSNLLSSNIPEGLSNGFFFPKSMYPNTAGAFSNVSTELIPNITAASPNTPYEQPAGATLTPLSISNGIVAPPSPSEPVGAPPSSSEPVGTPPSPLEPVPTPPSPSEPVGTSPSPSPSEPIGAPPSPLEPVRACLSSSNASFPTTRPHAPATLSKPSAHDTRTPIVPFENKNKPDGGDEVSQPSKRRGRPKKNAENPTAHHTDQISPTTHSLRKNIDTVEETVGLMTRAAKRKSLESSQVQSKRRKSN